MKRMCDLYADGNLRFIVTIVRCRFLCITENKKSANEHLTQTTFLFILCFNTFTCKI